MMTDPKRFHYAIYADFSDRTEQNTDYAVLEDAVARAEQYLADGAEKAVVMEPICVWARDKAWYNKVQENKLKK